MVLGPARPIFLKITTLKTNTLAVILSLNKTLTVNQDTILGLVVSAFSEIVIFTYCVICQCAMAQIPPPCGGVTGPKVTGFFWGGGDAVLQQGEQVQWEQALECVPQPTHPQPPLADDDIAWNDWTDEADRQPIQMVKDIELTDIDNIAQNIELTNLDKIAQDIELTDVDKIEQYIELTDLDKKEQDIEVIDVDRRKR